MFSLSPRRLQTLNSHRCQSSISPAYLASCVSPSLARRKTSSQSFFSQAICNSLFRKSGLSTLSYMNLRCSSGVPVLDIISSLYVCAVLMQYSVLQLSSSRVFMMSSSALIMRSCFSWVSASVIAMFIQFHHQSNPLRCCCVNFVMACSQNISFNFFGRRSSSNNVCSLSKQFSTAPLRYPALSSPQYRISSPTVANPISAAKAVSHCSFLMAFSASSRISSRSQLRSRALLQVTYPFPPECNSMVSRTRAVQFFGVGVNTLPAPGARKRS